jgi:hypothetical protein
LLLVRSGKGARIFHQTLIFLLLLSTPTVYPLLNTRVSSLSYAYQSTASGIVWITEPLQQVFNQVQNKFIGLVPGNYTEPTPSDYSLMKKTFTLINSGISNNDANSIRNASSLVAQINYQLLPINDSGTGNKFYVLMESSNVNRGWGSYFFSVQHSPSTFSPRVIIQAPHPVTDFNSQIIAYSIFVNSYPRVLAFFVSGVERTFGPNGQTDMAHRTQSIFETANEVFTSFGSVVIQIHSFNAYVHPNTPLVVLSTGDGGINGAIQSIASNLQNANLSVGVFDGFSYERLGAQNNVQGHYARSVGAGFVHAEVSSIVVYNATMIAEFESSVTHSVLSGFKFPFYAIDWKVPAIALGVMGIFLVASFRFSKTKAQL